MARTALLIATAFLVLSGLAFASAAPNFSGTWKMDRARSYGLPPDMNITLVITQTDDRIEFETKLIQPNNERSVKDTYVLDGKEYEFTPQVAPNQPQPKGKRTVTWLPGGGGLQVMELMTTESPNGPVQSQTVRKWTISRQGELVIDMYIDNNNGSFETKRIFIKE